MFRLTQTSETRGDCTASYDVQLDKDYTVKEFFEAVLENKADEWGAFYLMVRSKRLFWQNPSCEYRSGKRSGTTWANILIRYGDRKITQVKSDGGWIRMDYYIWLDEKPKEEPQTPPIREEQKMKNELPTTDALLVVQFPYTMAASTKERRWNELLKMKESGVVVIDALTRVLVIPKDIQVIQAKTQEEADELYEKALEAMRKYASAEEEKSDDPS